MSGNSSNDSQFFVSTVAPTSLTLLVNQISWSVLTLLIGGIFMFGANYGTTTRNKWLQNLFTVFSISMFVLTHFIAPVDCKPISSLRNFPICIGIMKVSDMYMRQSQPLTYIPTKTHPTRSPLSQAFLLSTQLRYESFTPNPIHKPPHDKEFSEPLALLQHVIIFAVLQMLPQRYDTVIAFEVLLTIYILWTSMHLVVRYEDSPPLFMPLWTADSLAGFWTDTWHNAFTSPCHSVGYASVRYSRYLQFPSTVRRFLGVQAAFAMMALFHVYCILPVLTPAGAFRIGLFFVMNGVASAAEVAVWGNKKNGLRRILAYAFEIGLATWVVGEAGIPQGLTRITWRNMCEMKLS